MLPCSSRGTGAMRMEVAVEVFERRDCRRSRISWVGGSQSLTKMMIEALEGREVESWVRACWSWERDWEPPKLAMRLGVMLRDGRDDGERAESMMRMLGFEGAVVEEEGGVRGGCAFCEEAMGF